MHGLRSACLLPLLLFGCAAEREAERAVEMEQALRSARAGLAMPGPGTPRRTETPAARTRPAGAAALTGLRAEEVRRRLGEPALRRTEGEAEIWLYEAPDCRLDVILYPEAGALLVGHAAARALGAARVTEAACLAAIPARAP